MANYGTTHRPVPTSPSPSITQEDESKNPTRKIRKQIQFTCPFDIPPTPESAAVRIVRNLGIYGLYYVIFVWTVLFITLVPKRKVSLIFLVAMTEVTFLYFLLLRALPESFLLHKIIDKRIVVFLLFIITAIQVILTGAGIHLLFTLSGTIPIVMVHAVLKITEDLVVNDQEGSATGELAQLALV
ncbi:PRA1 family protein F4-like [Forsythia ovata]|uniref:PRA1 family protein n=1 Tax=Forsythia ovata TaxID=205694 RepID=A0ABD1VH08_9LAMI